MLPIKYATVTTEKFYSKVTLGEDKNHKNSRKKGFKNAHTSCVSLWQNAIWSLKEESFQVENYTPFAQK